MFKQSMLAISLVAVQALSVTSLLVSVPVEAQQERKTKRVPAMRSKVYDQLARAQAQADEGNIKEAISILDGVKDRSSSMNSYELAMMHNFYAFTYYGSEDFDNAIKSFELVLEQQPIPETFEQTTLFSLAQLSMMRGNYDKTVEYLDRWEALQKGKIPAKNNVLKAQAMYQKKDYQAAIGYINAAIEEVENSDEGYQVDENWFVLQRAIYYELKQPENVAKVLEKMVRLFNKPEYWIQLAGMYGELGQEKKQLALMESAFQQGFIKSAGDIFNLAQLYYYHQVPYKGAVLVQKALDEGVLEKNLRNLRFLANCWSLAKENEKAVPALAQAAALSDNGELDAQLGQIFLNMDKYDQAISSASAALEKGGLRNQGLTHLVLGMAYYNKRRFVDALNQLAEAEKHQGSKAMAKQWGKFVQSEKASYDKLQAELSSS